MLGMNDCHPSLPCQRTVTGRTSRDCAAAPGAPVLPHLKGVDHNHLLGHNADGGLKHPRIALRVNTIQPVFAGRCLQAYRDVCPEYKGSKETREQRE